MVGEQRIRGGRAALGQALAQLLTSVRAAARGTAHLRVAAAPHPAPGEIVLELVLSGSELALGGDDWRAAGLGLWAARRTLAEQGGRLVEPMVDAAADATAPTLTWRVVLQAA